MKGKNEVLVGVTVVLGLIVMAIGTFWLTGRSWTQQQREMVGTFSHVSTLANGNNVVYRGVRVGRVENIALSERGNGVFVTMSVNPDVSFPQDAAGVIAPESLFGDYQVEIVSQAAYPDLEFMASTDPKVLPGAALPDISQLTQVAARIAADIEVLSDRIQITFTEETAVRLREAIENVSEVSQQLGGFVDQQTRTYDQVGRNVLTTTENISRASRSAEQLVTSVRANVDQGEIRAILTNARQASANLQALTAQLQGGGAGGGSGVPGLLTRADSVAVTLNQAARSVNALVEDLRPAAREAAPAVVQARQTLAEAQATLAKVGQAASAFGQSGGSLGRLLEDPALYEELQRTVANMSRLLADVQANPAKYIGEVRVLP